MSGQLLAALDLLLIVLGTAAFLGAATLTMIGRGSPVGRAGALALGCVGWLAVLGRIGVLVLLAGHGWWFVADKALLGVPLAVATASFGAAVAGPALVRRTRTEADHTEAGAEGDRTEGDRARRAAAGLFIAGYGSAAGLLVAFVVGYPVDPGPAIVVCSLVAGVGVLTWLGLTGRRRPRLTAALIVLCLVPALASAGLTFYRHIQPVVIGSAAAHHVLAAGADGAPGSTTASPAGSLSVAGLRTGAEPDRPVERFILTARQQQVSLPSGTVVDGWTFGSLPGPEIRVRQGDLVEVTLVNTDIADGVTVHWHGYRLPNGEDGVAGVTQDAVAPGESFTYRFVAADPGTYWYHAHQVSSEAVRRGLYGALIVEPAPTPDARSDVTPAGTDLVLPVHTFAGTPVMAGTDGVLARTVPVGAEVRVRLINTDPIPARISVAGADVTVSAVDGSDLAGPTPVGGRVLRIPAGGRYDVTFEMPQVPVGFGWEGAPGSGLRLAPPGTSGAADPGRLEDGGRPVPFVDGPDLDLLAYGSPAVPSGLDGSIVTREATLVLDRQFRFLNGLPTLAQTVNGEVHPFVPGIEVADGDLLRLTVVNRSAETHPMHPHGHRVLVESRDGEPVRGSPLWLDTFDVQPGEVWTVLLRADNPGIWMAHCHNLEHATEGMVVHLTYQGVSTPYKLGGGPADNRPE